MKLLILILLLLLLASIVTDPLVWPASGTVRCDHKRTHHVGGC